MAITEAKQDALAYIKEGQLDEASFQQFCNSFSVSALTIKYCIDLAIPQVSVEVYLFGARIGGGVINPSNPSITIGGSVAGFKAEVKLTADFTKNQVTYNITLCAPIVGCKNYSGVLFSW
ncbi:MAG: hypothetical protein DMF56_21900 [Acidobacteria bacterium]|nr:MAG: hypothetical protein DMF56_21900 [Acidobacteriota bacterium]